MHKEELKQQKDLLKAVLKNNEIRVCEYLVKEDKLIIYDEALTVEREIPNYLERLEQNSSVCPEDLWKMREFLRGRASSGVEVRIVQGKKTFKRLFQVLSFDGIDPSVRVPVIIRDTTRDEYREALLEDRATKDALTMLYNHFFGRELINEYLKNKDPYASCGLMLMDIDYFKYANDTYGHLFGDRVLIQVASLLQTMFDDDAVIMRPGGDEFVVFLKNISHASLVKEAMRLVKAIRKLDFSRKDYSVTCSVGACFLPENNSGYTYDQLFENADWALYRAKENGRNCYVFCDNLQRFEIASKGRLLKRNIDTRYLHNDIISTAFEIFEKTSSFSAAMELLMEVIGYRFQLDRITVIRTDIKEKSTGRQYQWLSDSAPEVLKEPGSFTKEDFITLFQSYDEYQTTVLQYDNMGMYSPGGAALLMQGEAKTVLYAAMYCEGQYTGAISYVVCREKRYWSKQNRKELGEVTKIISAHLARKQAVNQGSQPNTLWTEYDSLTGLLSFSRFHIEAEHLIVGEYASSHLMLYSDFAGFKYFNQKYGYSTGDKLLKEFASFYMEKLGSERETFFSRVSSDQFLLLIPYKKGSDIAARFDAINKEFERMQTNRYQGARIRIRTGIYVIEPGCTSASFAMDAANYARKQITGNSPVSVRIYDDELRRKQAVENEIVNGIDEAIQEQRFQIYLQPKISLENGQVLGAEALVRWLTKEGTLLTPADFIPLCETSGRIEELDYYVFERVVAFLAKNQKLGRRQVPISVNASILHASDPKAVQKYLDILKKYQIEPEYTEIELTETATVEEYENARQWFRKLREAGIRTAMDDFGAGYSVLNSVIDIPVDTVKLDRAFVRTCSSGERGIFFLKKVIGMIRGLGYHVVCEGIETPEQSQIVREAGCEEGQGYLFSKPLSLKDYEEFVYSDK